MFTELTENDLTETLIDALRENQYIPDETDAFCTRIAVSLKRLPRRQRSQLEIKILQLVTEYEDEFDD